ncbi:sulfite oxidase [Williamsia sp. SKLECPSW1]
MSEEDDSAMPETPMTVHETAPLNAETPPQHLGSRLTDPTSFYVRSHGDIPDIDPETWELVVEGMVRTPLRLRLSELRSQFTSRTVEATLQCAGNRRTDLMAVRDIPGEAPWDIGAISTARWTGVRLRDVLDRAGLADAALHIAVTASDVAGEAEPPQTYGGSIDREKALSDEVLLAWSMNDRPLPSVHGGPVRMVVPGYIGARSVKWVQSVSAQTSPSDNYFERVSYRMLSAEQEPGPEVGTALTATPVTSAVIDPVDGAEISAGPASIRGYAIGGHGHTVTSVQVSTDGGATWTDADLDEESSPWSWRHWHLPTHLTPGDHTITVRARDSGSGEQPVHAADLWNPKGYANNAWHSVTVRAR